MSSRADVRVRLSPEGVAEVVAALRLVQREGEAANRSGAGGINAAGTALRQFRTVLGALGIATTIAGFVGLGKAAFNSAQEISKAAKQTGTGVEEFSRLAYVMKQADIELGSFTTAITFYQKRVSEAITDPNGEAAASFKQIGLEASVLQKLSLTDQLKSIADRVAALGASEDKTRASSDLFGRSVGAQMVRALNDGAEGIARFTAESDRAGATLSTRTAEGIDKADAALKRLKATISGFATRALGRIALDILGEADELANLTERRNAILRGSVRLPGPEQRRQLEQLNAQIAALQKQRAATPAKPAGAGEKLIDVETPEERKAKLDAQRARIQAELKLTQEGIKAAENAQQAGFEQSLLSVQDYFARRRALVEAGSEVEIRALERQIALVQATAPKDDADKIRQAAEVEKLRSEIVLKRLEMQNVLAALADEELVKGRELATQQADAANELDELEGRRHEAFVRHLEEEARLLRELLTRAGATPSEIDAQVGRLQRSRTAQFDFEEASRRGRAALDAFDRDAEQIRRDQEAGVIGQIQGEDRLIELERQRLELLKQLTAESLKAAEATGNPEAIEQARQFAASVGEIEASYRSATDEVLRFKQGTAEGFREGIRGILENTDEIHSLRDAFEQLGDTILDVFKRLSADIISKSLTRGLENALGIGTGATGAESGGTGGFLASLAGFFGKLFSGARQGGLQRARGFAEGGAADAGPGGLLRGPGTGTSDSIPAIIDGRRPVRLSNEEYIVRNAVVRQPGALGFLHAFNQRGMAALRGFAHGGSLRAPQIIAVPRFADGGLASAAMSARRPDRNVMVDFRPVIQAPTPELGRRTSQQAASMVGRELTRAQRRSD